MGEFETRLKLLEAMQEQLRNSTSRHSEGLKSTIHNVHQLHAQFRKAVNEHISAERVKLEKDMKEVILLASWKDTNVTALKESTKRSHYQLYKVVKKYRSILATPVSTIARAADLGTLEPSSLAPLGRDLPATSTEDIALCTATINTWDSRPARLLNISSTVSKMQQGRVSSTPGLALVSNLVNQFSDSILQRAQELRDSTPSKLTKDNTTEVRRIQDAKRKAVNEALKSLRQMGFKSNLSQRELMGQASAVEILGSTPAIASEASVLSDIPADVPVPDLVRGSKYFEHGLSIILQQREAIASHLKAVKRLHDVIGYFLAFCEQPGSGQDASPKLTFGKSQDPTVILQQLSWIPANINFALKVVDAEARFSLGDHQSLRNILQRWNQWAITSVTALRACPDTFSGVLMPRQQQLISGVLQGFEVMKTELSQFADANPPLKHIVTYLQPWIPTSGHALNAIENHGFRSTGGDHILELDSDIQRLCDTILALVQPETLDASTTKTAGGPEKPVLVEHEKMLASRASAGCSTIIDHLENLGSKLRTTATEDLLPIRAVMRLMTPIIVEYENICHREVVQWLDFHQSICRLTHILSNFVINIGTNGFCAPSDGSAEAGGAGQLESGTGLGDGEGEEDISNDIAPDEDLSELAKQKEEEGSSKKDYDAEENAVENDDIDGMSESGSEKSDREGEEGEGEEEDMAEEMGKVDDSHGLDSLDKDFWDNPDEEPKEEVDAGPEGEKQDDASAEDEADGVEARENENLNEHIPEVERLDISDDFDLDKMEEELDEDDNEMDLSDGEEEEKDGFDGNIEDTDNHEKQLSDVEEEDHEMMDQTADNMEGADSSEDEREKDGEEQPEDALQEPTDDPIDNDLDTPKAPQNVEASGAATSSGDTETNAEDPITSNTETEKDNEQGTAPESSRQNATDGQQGDTGQAEYRTGSGQSDLQSKEQRLENSLKKLGDLLEKVLRTPMDILDPETSQGPKEEVSNPEDQKQSQFEHVGEDDRQSTAQALGAATTEEAHTIDESMVINSAPDPSEQPTTTGDDDMVDDSVEGATGKESNEHTGFQEESEELEDTPVAAASNPQDDSEATMEVDVPRLMANPHKDGTDQNSQDIDMELDDYDEQNQSQDPKEPIDHTSLGNSSQAQSLWTLYEDKTRVLSLSLTEQLRLILEPTLSTKLRGDYRTGKRLNMKRIIPYIASDYKKDKIWMRRTKPSKRQYQVMIALDDSKSMSEPRCVELSLESIALVARALTHLEVGQIAMVSFGETTQLVHPFEQPFTAQAGANIFANLSFSQTKTNMKSLVETSIRLFREAKQMNQQSDLWQLELIISDGICEDHKEVQRLVRLAHFEKIVLIFVIIDAAGGSAGTVADGAGMISKGSASILDMKEAIFTDQGGGKGPKLQVNRYIDTFPFNYYLIIRRIEDLPGMLSTALRQWFSQAAEASS
ncbi:Midasin [Orbilia brochopaga]|nr:Midasin [Drechslerella brochopaga]